MQVTYYNHASINIKSNKGFKLLSDPWVYGPIYGGSMWQFPTCEIKTKEYYSQDAIYISHTHPDHYCLNTLKKFSKSIPIYIREYDESVPLKKQLSKAGFKNITEVKHKQRIKIHDDFYITVVHDKKTVDSLIICENNNKTFLMQNDCFLDDVDYKWIRSKYKIDLAGIFFMGIGPFPGSFVLPWSEKEDEVQKKKLENFERAKRTSKLIGAKNIFPCSNDMIWYMRPDLAILNGALPYDFKKFMAKTSKKTNVILINSGDKIETGKMKIKRVNDRVNFNNKHQQLDEYFRIYYNNNLRKNVEELKKWENNFTFNRLTFMKKFSMYLKNINTKKLFKNLKKFKVGIRINNKDKPNYFIFDSDKLGKKSVKQVSTISDLYKNVNMVIQIRGELVDMALKGFYTFEDLSNCNYLIDRFNEKYSANEGMFWTLMSEFSWFLEDNKLNKNQNAFLKKQILTSRI